MPRLLIGTANPAKLAMLRSALAPLRLAIQSVGEVGIHMDVVEDGCTAQENARKKSLAYAAAAGQPVLSVDNALYLDGLPDDQQPGIHTRRIDNRSERISDAELLAHYCGVISRLSEQITGQITGPRTGQITGPRTGQITGPRTGQITGRWEFAVCLAAPPERLFEHTIISPRLFTARPSPVMLPGYPLESLQIEPGSGKYISEMTLSEQDAFWQEMIGTELCSFMAQALNHIQL